MAEIKITYETLFDLLRREKSRGELQELERSFYDDVSFYLSEKSSSLNLTSSRAEMEKIRIQIKNVKKILKELYELREKKIIAIASSKVRTNSNLIDTSKLLDLEKDLFEDACVVFSKHKSLILEATLSKGDQEDIKSEKESSSTKESKSKDENLSVTNDVFKIKILHDLPRFLGIDKKIYGPFSKGDVVDIPSSTATFLLEKNRAEKL